MTKETLWTQTGVAAATGGSIMRPFEVKGIAIDSRSVEKGDLFIAIKARRDGHYFIRNAAQSGAVAALISWKPKNIPAGFPVIFVRNTEEGLQKLALAARSRMRGKVVAITGSAGKTTTKDVLGQVLSKSHKTHVSKGSFNNELGVPLSMARMPADTQFGIFEIGMNHAGEITPLVKMVRPDIAVITTVGCGHLEFFESEEQIAEAKAEIFLGVKEGGTAVLNADNKHYEFLCKTATELGLKIVPFGMSEEAKIRLLSVENIEGQSQIEISVYGQLFTFKTKLLGEHNARNIAAIMAVVTELGLDLAEIAHNLSEIVPSSGRGDVMILPAPDNNGEFSLINESYNANPLSMRAALENMKMQNATGKGLKIAVLGEMRELGTQSTSLHIELKDIILDNKFDRIYLVGGDPMEALYDALGEDSPSICAAVLDDIQDEIISETSAGSVVFIKGSHSIGLERLISLYKKEDKVETLPINDNKQVDCDDSQDENNKETPIGEASA